MGNCVSQTGQKEFLKSLRNSTVDSALLDSADSFLVYVKKKHRLVPGALKITDREILFFHGCNDLETWPFLYLRRYGYTSGGVFFFESGRRCSTGEGLHTFQTCQSETIFQLVQSRIQDSAATNVALRDSAGQSIVDNIRNACLYHTGRTTVSRIHPLQRYFSEGTVYFLIVKAYFFHFILVEHFVLDLFCFEGASNADEAYRSLRTHRHFRRHNHKHSHALTNRSLSISATATPKRSRSSQLFTFVDDGQNDPSSLVNSGETHPYANFKTQSPSSLRNQSEAFNFTCVRAYSSSGSPKTQSEPGFPLCDQCFFGHYVNVTEIAECTHMKCKNASTSPTLDYASVNITQTVDKDISQPSVSVINDSEIPCRPTCSKTVNYTEIDLEKTHAAEMATKVLELENPQRRHPSTA